MMFPVNSTWHNTAEVKKIIHCHLGSENWVCVVYHPKLDYVCVATLYFSVIFEELSCVLFNGLFFPEMAVKKHNVYLAKCCSCRRGYCILSLYNFRSNKNYFCFGAFLLLYCIFSSQLCLHWLTYLKSDNTGIFICSALYWYQPLAGA